MAKETVCVLFLCADRNCFPRQVLGENCKVFQKLSTLWRRDIRFYFRGYAQESLAGFSFFPFTRFGMLSDTFWLGTLGVELAHL
jgi:hypothetical protein